MELRCRVCDATQPVTCGDEADEDVRTRAIRQAFRAEHVARCGAGAVTLALTPREATIGESDPILAWASSIAHPDDVTPMADGSFTRRILRDGSPFDVRVCEDCWQAIPRYVDFPFGLVSPESDGDAEGHGAKTRRSAVEGKVGIEPLRKVVCLPCYLAAFVRVYPGADVPEFCGDLIGDGDPAPVPPPPAHEVSVGDPTKALA